LAYKNLSLASRTILPEPILAWVLVVPTENSAGPSQVPSDLCDALTKGAPLL